MKITNYELKITIFFLQIRKLLLLLLPTTIYTSWAKNQQFFLNKIKGSAYYGFRQETTGYNSPSVYGSQTYDGRCCFITILMFMTTIKNYFEWLLGSEDSLSDYQLLTLLEKGGVI